MPAIKTYHDYFIEVVCEAGLAQVSPEVKSLRTAKVNVKGSYCRISKGEIFVHSMHISPCENGNRENPDPLRIRKLLLHCHEIGRLVREFEEKGIDLRGDQTTSTRW
jgi:SsrA-binding protein